MNNPPAFPSDAAKDSFAKIGMSLRDYFAAQIISGIVANEKYHHIELADMTAYSNFAYLLADSMLKVREE